jgi:hypothetical protein
MRLEGFSRREEMEDQIVLVLQKFPVVIAVLSALGSLVVLATIVAPFTPTKKDDDAIAYAQSHPVLSKVMALLMRFSLIQPKAPAQAQ